jgi:hypothetical protein
MRYTVTWTKAALNELADIYNNASDRRAVTDASNRIDRELRNDAHQKGHSLQGGRRFLRVPPLLVAFTFSQDDRMVSVLKVLRLR